MADEKKSGSLPYVSFKSITHFIEWLREVGVPQVIDRSVWGDKWSGAYGSQLIYALRFLRLIDDTYKPNIELEKIVKEPNKEKELLADAIKKSYAPFVRGLDIERASQKQLQDKFGEYGLTGATLRKAVTLFIHSARYAEIPLSPHIVRRAKGSGERRKSPRRTSGANGNPQSSFPPPAGNSGGSEMPSDAPAQKSLILWGLFLRLPKPGDIWSQSERDSWIEAAKTVFKLEYREDQKK